MYQVLEEHVSSLEMDLRSRNHNLSLITWMTEKTIIS